MPDISDRRTREAAHAREIDSVFADIKRQLLATRSASIDWQSAQDRLAEVLRKKQEDIFLLAVLLFLLVERRKTGDALQNDDFVADAAAWASGDAESLASNVLANSARRVNTIAAQVSRLETAVQGQAFEKMVSAHFSLAKAETLAADSITRSITVGERVAQRRLDAETGKRRMAVWVTERDARVCPICRPLHLKLQADWPLERQNGPPAHPRCRCFLLYRIVSDPIRPQDRPFVFESYTCMTS